MSSGSSVSANAVASLSFFPPPSHPGSVRKMCGVASYALQRLLSPFVPSCVTAGSCTLSAICRSGRLAFACTSRSCEAGAAAGGSLRCRPSRSSCGSRRPSSVGAVSDFALRPWLMLGAAWCMRCRALRLSYSEGSVHVRSQLVWAESSAARALQAPLNPLLVRMLAARAGAERRAVFRLRRPLVAVSAPCRAARPSYSESCTCPRLPLV